MGRGHIKTVHDACCSFMVSLNQPQSTIVPEPVGTCGWCWHRWASQSEGLSVLLDTTQNGPFCTDQKGPTLRTAASASISLSFFFMLSFTCKTLHGGLQQLCSTSSTILLVLAVIQVGKGPSCADGLGG